MATGKVSDFPAIAINLTENKTGNWIADCDVDATENIEGNVEINIFDVVFNGYVLRGEFKNGRWSGRVIGGNGGINNIIESRYYISTPVREVLSEIATDCGEQISSSLSRDILNFPLNKWLRPQGPANQAINDLVNALNIGFQTNNITWRVLRNGQIWIGRDSYIESTIDFVETSSGATSGTVEIAPSDDLVAPGVSIFDKNVSNVTTILSPKSIRQILYFEDTNKNIDRFVNIFKLLIDKFVRRDIDFSGTYPAKVISQDSDGNLELLPDDPRIKGRGLKRVPIRPAIAGTKITINSGAKVRIMFDEFNPRKPFAALFDTNPADISLIEIGSNADFVALNQKVLDELNKIKDYINMHTHPTGVGPSGAPTSPMPEPSSMASEILKVK